MRRRSKPLIFDSVEPPKTYNFVDLMGRQFHKLTVVGFAGKVDRRSYWRCRCECGQQTVVLNTNLTRDHTTSCGCTQSAVTSCRNMAAATHGESNPPTPEFRAWSSMQDRCDNPKDARFKYYGALGVTVCERWRSSYLHFLADMGRKPTPKHSIDRWPDNCGDYEPGNCRWATPYQQVHNRRAKPRAEERAND